MKKIVTSLLVAGMLGFTAQAQAEVETRPAEELSKGMVIVEDFGENLGLDELLDAFEKLGIKVNRVRHQGRSSYQAFRASYRGNRYDLTVSRTTGKITWLTKFDISASVFD